MDFFAKNYQVRSILSNKEYNIPEYQREYTWETEQLSAFWNDINGEDGRGLFLGTLVLVGDNFTDNIGPFDVVDGQQRLTTILLLLNRIINRFNELKEVNLASALEKRLKFLDDNATPHLSLENVNAHSFFQKIVFHNIACSDESEEAKKLQSAKSFFEKKLEEYIKEDLTNLRDLILGINIIVAVQEDKDKAFEMFETLNFRGMDLDILDLVKSFIVRKYPKDAGIDDPRETWKNILRNIKNDRKNFFNRYWASLYKKVSDKKLYKEFEGKMKTFEPKEVRIFLDDIQYFSKIYENVLSPNDFSWEGYCPYDRKYSIKMKNSIESLSKFKMQVHYPLLINTLNLSASKSIHQNVAIELIEVLERFHYAFNAICSKSPSGMDSKYSKFAIMLIKEPDKAEIFLKELKADLRDKMPSEDEFVEKFSELNFENQKGTILYSFRLLEKIYNPSLDVDITEESIDHMCPQSEQAVWRHKIGNLILLEKKLNNIKDTDGLMESLEKLKGTEFKSTKKSLDLIKNTKVWDEERVKERSKILAKEIYKYCIKCLS